MGNDAGRAGADEPQGGQAVNRAKSWIELAGRMGFTVKGVLYVLIGALATQAAYGVGGATTGSRGALREILQLPFGRTLLVAVGVGLAGYALWRFVQAAMDTENKGTGLKGWAARAGYAVIGLIHLGLAASAAALVLGGSGAGGAGTKSSQGWAAWLLSQPLGRWLVGAVAVVVAAVGLYQFHQAYRVKFRQRLKIQEMSRTEETWVVRLGRVGYAARGVVFCISGGLVGLAAIRMDPTDAQGLEGALEALEHQNCAPWLFGLVAIGLAAYGVFQFFLARYRRMVVG